MVFQLSGQTSHFSFRPCLSGSHSACCVIVSGKLDPSTKFICRRRLIFCRLTLSYRIRSKFPFKCILCKAFFLIKFLCPIPSSPQSSRLQIHTADTLLLLKKTSFFCSLSMEFSPAIHILPCILIGPVTSLLYKGYKGFSRNTYHTDDKEHHQYQICSGPSQKEAQKAG